jgi:HD-GYP domain-containing protein (c-di-GMP phosphodiesterase class II)
MALILLQNIDQLRLGLFIKIQGSWFSHPFSVSSFKIKTVKELDTIRGLTRVKLFYDPTKSDPDPNAVPSDDTSSEENPILATEDSETTSMETEEDDLLTSAAEPEAVEESRADTKEKAAALQKQRNQIFQEQMSNLKKVEGTYSKVLKDSEAIFNNLVANRPESIKAAKHVVAGMVDVFRHQAVSMTLMEVLGSNGLGWGLSTHSLNVSIMSLLIGHELGIPKEDLQFLGLGALFHDLGERLVPMKVKFMEGGMKMQSDASLHKMHPQKGCEWLEKFSGFPPEALTIIMQHHERLNGTGYPQGLTQDNIGLPSQIVMVADEYDEMCNAPRQEDRRTPHQALGILFRAFMGTDSHKFSEEVVQALIRVLTVYPPGTYVQLSDESVGVVTSINQKDPTHPLIMLYTPQEIKNEVTIIDLAKNEHLKIEKVLRPNELSSKVLEKLSRHHVAIFLHAGEEITQPAPA